MKPLFVSILECSDGTYYTGVTNNITRRLDEHQTGKNEEAYTFSRRPVNLVYSEEIFGPLKAISREKQIKRWSYRKKEALIEGRFDDLKKLAKKKF